MINPDVRKALEDLNNEDLIQLYTQLYHTYMNTGSVADLNELGDVSVVILERMQR